MRGLRYNIFSDYAESLCIDDCFIRYYQSDIVSV